MRRVVVTGGSGLLGSNLALEWRERFATHASYHTHSIQVPGVDSSRVDLREPEPVLDLLHRVRPDTVVHCAAQTRVDWCEDHPRETREANVAATRNVARACEAVGAHLIHISTDSVFDGENAPYSEEAAPHPLNVYARSKLEAEAEARQAQGTAVVRCGIYGWNARPKVSLAEWGLRELEATGTVNGLEDCWFSPMLVNDLAHVLARVVDRRLEGTYHAGSRDGTSKLSFLRTLAGLFGYSPDQVRPVTRSQLDLRARRPRDLRLDVSRLEATLGMRMPTVREGLERFHGLVHNGYVRHLRAAVQPPGTLQ